jgi:hypothetical protein
VIPISSIDVVIRLEVLPSLVADSPITNYFRDFRFTGFSPQVDSSVAVGRLECRRLSDAQSFSIPIGLAVDALDRVTPEQVFTRIDYLFKEALKQLEAFIHIDGVLCRNNFCEECYK